MVYSGYNSYRHLESSDKISPKSRFSFPTKPMFPHTNIHTDTDTTNITVDEVVTSVKDIITSLVEDSNSNSSVASVTENILITDSGNSAITTTLPELLNKTTGFPEVLPTTLIDVIEMTTSDKIVEVIETTTENVFLNDSTTIYEDYLTTTVESVQNVTELMDWKHINDDENPFFNTNLTMLHREYEETSHTLFVLLGLILGVLILIGVALVFIYVKYRKSNSYVLDHETRVRKNRVISKTSDICYPDESACMEPVENEGSYKF